MSARSGSSLMERGFHPKLGSTQGAFDQSLTMLNCPAPPIGHYQPTRLICQDADQTRLFYESPSHRTSIHRTRGCFKQKPVARKEVAAHFAARAVVTIRELARAQITATRAERHRK